MKMKWTVEQENAIKARKGSVLVSAAAGSGKTAVLTQRVIERITDRENPTSVDRLLIVTFTRAAAQEMRERISDRVSALLKENPGDINLINQQMLLPGAKITTIDSFCMNLVKENFQLLGNSPDFRMAEESELKIIKAAAMDEAVEEMYSEGSESFRSLIEVLFKGRDDSNIEEAMNKLYESAMSYPFPETRIKEFSEFFSKNESLCESRYGKIIMESVKDTLIYVIETCNEILSAIENDEILTKILYNAVSTDKAQCEYILGFLEEGNWDETRRAVSGFSPTRKGNTPKDLKEDPLTNRLSDIRKKNVDRIRKLSELMCTSEEEYYDDMAFFAPLMESLTECTLKFHRIFTDMKKEKKLSDFSDIAHMALSLLVTETDEGYENTDFAKEVSLQFDEILIDEYQDTNKAQDMLFSAVSRNNLFRVGDVKQSIYSFRQAMPEIFLSLKNTFELYDCERDNYPSKIILGNNFRSRKGVTDIINFIFNQIMSEQSGDIEYGEEERLVASASYEPKTEADTELHILDIAELDRFTENSAVCQAKYAADLINKMIADGYTVKDGSTERRATYKDFAVLLRAVGSEKGVTYAEVFRQKGIPAFTEVSGKFLMSGEIALAINMLKIIDNPRQDIPLMSVMMSPVFGFTPDEISELRTKTKTGVFEEDKKADIYSCLLRMKDKSEKVDAFLSKISFWRNLCICLTVSELLSEIYEDTALIPIFDAVDKSGTKRANLMLLSDYAAAYEKSGKSGLTGFLGFIERLRDKKQDMSGSLGISQQADVVKIMTIHKSKGLEFPVCILSGCAGEFNMMDLNENMVISHKEGIGLLRRNPETFEQYKTLCHTAVRLSMKNNLLSEEMRVLYVALTRAREKLIMIYADENPLKKCESMAVGINPLNKRLNPVVVKSANSYGKWIIPALLRHEGAKKLREAIGMTEESVLPSESPLKVVFSVYESEEKVKQTEKGKVKADEDFLRLIEERAGFKYKYEALSKILTKRAASEVDRDFIDRDYFASSMPAFMYENGLTGALRGIATHTFIQFADYNKAKVSVKDEIDRLYEMGVLSESQAKGINIKAVEGFFESRLSERILASPLVMREKKFTIEVPVTEIYPEAGESAEGEMMMIQGIADCAFLEDGELVVVDYKTDRLQTEESFSEKYASQVLLYKRALQECTGYRVKETLLYSFYLGKEIRVI
ncbi:MAG: helicase-exonuclease AddAB subunit AddA [Clostridia bacterium]|nr:helicase-exonuclease AddAB subunit AddA [Clostridia bacterium]